MICVDRCSSPPTSTPMDPSTSPFSSSPFGHLPSDILVLLFQNLDLPSLASLGRTSAANHALYSTLSLSTHLTQHYPFHRSLSLSPSLDVEPASSSSSTTWSPSSLARHLHLSSLRLARRQFVARPLPLPVSGSKKRVAALRPLLAVGWTRMVVGGVGGRRGCLVVYEFEQRRKGEGMGEMRVGAGWEVRFGSGVGVRAEQSETRAERREEEEGERRTGTGGLLSGDLTGLEFFGGDEADLEERTLLLSFANGVVQTVQLPIRPVASSSTASNQKGRRGKSSKPQPTPPPVLELVRSHPHLPSPIQSLSVASGSPSSLFLTSSYSSVLSLYSATSSLTTLTLPYSHTTPWSTLLLPSSSSFVVGTSSSLLYSPLPSSSSSVKPGLLRSLLPSTNTSAAYALHCHPLNPSLLLSAHSHPLACVLMHDLRTSLEGGVARFSDPWTEQSWYSVGMTEDGRGVVGGTGGGGRVGVWDVRNASKMSSEGAAEKAGKGWTCFAPSAAEPTQYGVMRDGGYAGEVGKLVVKGTGRVWGVTPTSPFLFDFSPGANLASLYSSLAPAALLSPNNKRASSAVQHDYGYDLTGKVSWYEHEGEKVVLGLSKEFV